VGLEESFTMLLFPPHLGASQFPFAALRDYSFVNPPVAETCPRPWLNIFFFLIFSDLSRLRLRCPEGAIARPFFSDSIWAFRVV